MTHYKILYHDRNYNDYTLYNANTHEEIIDRPTEFDPVKNKLFHADVFTINEDNASCDILHSIVRETVQYPGILLLESNMYGKYKNKFIYKCIPDDKHLPIFLIAHQEKHVGFSKKKTNKYITFQYKSWENQHPEAIIKNNIGSVEDLNNFYEYQLFCKSLNASIQGFTKDAKRSINKINTTKTMQDIIDEYNIELRNDQYIFSIDNEGTQDFDDAFSICQQNKNQTKVSIYITNVPIWIDVLNLWSSFTDRISSIYLPDRKRPMLPTILSNILCSLYKEQLRIALAMDIVFENEEIISISYHNVAIQLDENLEYNGVSDKHKHYKLLKQYTKILYRNTKFVTKQVANSKDVVSYLMMFMNYHSAKTLDEHSCGIFRSVTLQEREIPASVPPSLYKFVKIWNSSSGQYTTQRGIHDFMEINAYTHITSPMRRLIDLLNILVLQETLGLYQFSHRAKEFVTYWINRLDYINVTTRAIRKIQSDSNLLHWCNVQNDLSHRVFRGHVFDKLERNDGLFQYVVFIQEINMASKIIIRHDVDNYSEHYFSLHVFHKKDTFKKRVRLHFIEYTETSEEADVDNN